MSSDSIPTKRSIAADLESTAKEGVAESSQKKTKVIDQQQHKLQEADIETRTKESIVELWKKKAKVSDQQQDIESTSKESIVESPRKKAKVSDQQQDKLQEALSLAGFSIFKRILDLGFVGWRPPTTEPFRYKSLSKATASEIRAYTIFNESPRTFVESHNIALPLNFSTTLASQFVLPKFPYAQIAVAALYHAFCQWGVEKSSIDFVFGCSALEVLTSCKTPKKAAQYLVMKVPGTQAIMLHYHFDFRQDYSQPGFQFERLMLGMNITDDHNVGYTEHVQLMEIGGQFRVLMTAEVDGVDQEGYPVEMKLLKGGVGRKVMFQMIGSGSLTLIQGKNDKGVLRAVHSKNLADIASNIAQHQNIASLESKIIGGMQALKRFDEMGYFQHGEVYQMEFNPEMELKPCRKTCPLLPPAQVLQELFNARIAM